MLSVINLNYPYSLYMSPISKYNLRNDQKSERGSEKSRAPRKTVHIVEGGGAYVDTILTTGHFE